MTTTLEDLLTRIDAGTASEDEMAQARALLDAQGDALGSMVRAGLAHDPGHEVVDDVMAAIGAERPLVADAIRSEAGEVDIAAEALAQVEAEAPWPVAEAVHALAGPIDIAEQVLSALDAPGLPIAQAVQSEAGAIDIADRVMAELAAPVAMPAPSTAPVLPRPANTNRRWMMSVLAAAAVMLVVGAGTLVGGLALVGGLSGGADGTMGIASHGGSPTALVPAAEMVFAQMGEIVIVDLEYGENVNVFQEEGDAGAMILWVDEEVL